MSSRCALRITEQGEAGPAFTALLGRGRSSFGRAPLRSLACMGRVRRTASPALRAYMPRALISAPPAAQNMYTSVRIAVFRPDFDARVRFVRRCAGLFESRSLQKKPELGDRHGLRCLWRREGLEAPLRAAVRCGRSRGLACFAGKRRVSSAPHLHRVRIPHPLQCPHPKGTQARYSLWRRERDSNPRDAHAPNGFQDRRIQPLCHLSVVGNDSIEYRPA